MRHSVKGKITCNLGDDDDEWEIEYEAHAEEPATGPTYASGGEPGCPAYAEILSSKLNGVETELPDEYQEGVQELCFDDASDDGHREHDDDDERRERQREQNEYFRRAGHFDD